MQQTREIVLDTETTGLYPKNGDRIVEIGCVEIINKIRTGVTYHTYINPQRDMPMEAYKVHGISAEFLQDKPVFRKVADSFLDFIGSSVLVIHNAGFDLGFLNHELALQGYPPINMGRVVDTLTVARKKYPGAPASLDALCRKYSISLEGREKHGALLDADLLAQVYLHLTGGVQASIDLNNDPQIQSVMATKIRQTFSKRDFSPLFEEVSAHAEYIEQSIPNSIWKSNT